MYYRVSINFYLYCFSVLQGVDKLFGIVSVYYRVSINFYLYCFSVLQGVDKPFCIVSVYYRVSINFTSLGFTQQLGDRNSVAFQQLARELSEAIESLFRNTPGKQVVTILQFR